MASSLACGKREAHQICRLQSAFENAAKIQEGGRKKKNPNCLFFALSIRRALHLKTIAQVARLRECLCMTEGVKGIPERCFKKTYIMGLGAESQRRDDKVAQISRAAVTTIFIQSPSFRRRWSPLPPPPSDEKY